jgi:hypothetical protein
VPEQPAVQLDSTPRADFDRQLDNLISKGYPDLAGLAVDEFASRLAPLADQLPSLPRPAAGDRAHIQFVIVVTNELVPPDQAMPAIQLGRKQGFTTMPADDLKRFIPIDGIARPERAAYLITGLDTGPDTLNVIPDEAIKTIAAQGRSPLTVDEGIALVTQYPDVLKTRNCFSMLGSRCGDRRVPALWLSAGRPRLGWCWAGAPHTWLGSASCATRLG